MIPNYPKFSKIDLCVFKPLPVMPTVKLRYSQDMSEWADPVVQICMLKSKMNDEDRKPAADDQRGGSQEAQYQQSRSSHNCRVKWMTAFSIKPI